MVIDTMLFNVRAIKEAKKRFGEKTIQLIFVVLPKYEPLYEKVKLLADIDYGIPTQGIYEDKFIKTNPGYHNNLTLKINAKIDGRNQFVVRGQMPAVFTNQPTMMIGADVCHPGYHNPLAEERVISSIAAVVGSYDLEFTKYVVNVTAQPPKQEYLTNLHKMVASLLNFFKEKHKRFPAHVVFFRDGVSESQLDAVKNGELPLIEDAFRRMGADIPKITAMVVQKRHHTRFIPTNAGNNKGGNIGKGTYVDHTITSPLYEEFYLASHDSPLVSTGVPPITGCYENCLY